MKRIASPQTNWKKVRAIACPYWKQLLTAKELRQLKSELEVLLGTWVRIKSSYDAKPAFDLKIEAIQVVAAKGRISRLKRLFEICLFGTGPRKTCMVSVFSESVDYAFEGTEYFLASLDDKQDLLSSPRFVARLLAEELTGI